MVEFMTSRAGFAASESRTGLLRSVDTVSVSPVVPRSPLYVTMPTVPSNPPSSVP